MRFADQQVVHVIVARTAAGSSARFVAAFACMFLGETKSAQQMNSSSSGALTDLLFSEPPSPMLSLNPARSRGMLMRHSTGGAVRAANSWLEDELVTERQGPPDLHVPPAFFPQQARPAGPRNAVP